MTVYPTAIPGVMIIEPRLFPDSRGYFFEAYVSTTFIALCVLKYDSCRTMRAAPIMEW